MHHRRITSTCASASTHHGCPHILQSMHDIHFRVCLACFMRAHQTSACNRARMHMHVAMSVSCSCLFLAAILFQSIDGWLADERCLHDPCELMCACWCACVCVCVCAMHACVCTWRTYCKHVHMSSISHRCMHMLISPYSTMSPMSHACSCTCSSPHRT